MVFETVIALRGVDIVCSAWKHAAAFGRATELRLLPNTWNLQNLPASSRYAKWIKSCFKAPPGWLFLGLDFASLEDRISALTTKDPNKLRVYTDGFDGHSLRAAAYWPDKMPEITYKLSKKNLGGKFYKITVGSKTDFYHESDLPDEAKRSLGLLP